MQTKKRAVILITVIGLLAISGLAMADSHFDDDDDGVFNFGADEGEAGEQFLFWNITSLENGDDDLEDLWDSCALEDEGPFEYEYDHDEDELVLTGYTVDETCGPFQGGDVTEDGHPYNHGAYMSYFNSQYEGNGRGCMNSHLAKSGFGKQTDEDPGELDFSSVAVDCQHGNYSNDLDGLGSESSETGQAKWGDEKPGKSGDAPGHNK